MLTTDRVSWGVDNIDIITDISMHIERGEFVGLIGPNGSGKSSLLKTIYRFLKPQAGVINVSDENVWQLSARDAAKKMAVVTQAQTSEFDFTVEEIVAMGRTPHYNWLEHANENELKMIHSALTRVGLQTSNERQFNSLSGGEKQRVLIARALIQSAEFLIMDEPTNHLDIRYQLELLSLLRDLPQTKLVALHDLNMAAEFCDRLYLLVKGRVFASGPSSEVLTPSNLKQAYGVNVEIYSSQRDQRPRLFFKL